MLPSSTKNSIIFVVNDASFFVSHRLSLALEAKRRGLKPIVAAPNAASNVTLAAKSISAINIPLERLSLNPISDLRTLWSLVQLYQKLRPGIVHHITIKPVIYGSLAARIANVRAVVNSISGLGFVFLADGLKGKLRRFLVERLYSLSLARDGIEAVFQNEDDRALFVSRGLIAASRTRVIRASGISRCVLGRHAEIPEKTVLMMSRVLREKGLEEYVEAARQLRESGLKIRFLHAGRFEPKNPGAVSRNRYEAWRRDGAVHFLGYRTDSLSLLSLSSICCLPSYREGLPKFLLEAAAIGRPIVATDVPGCREIVCDGLNGRLVPARDALALAEALEELICNQALRERMSLESRRLFEQGRFDEEHLIEKTFGLYSELFGKTRGADTRNEDDERFKSVHE